MRAKWHSLVARNGTLESFSIVHTDNSYGKRRYAVELDFAQRRTTSLIVFEPRNGEIIGLFFADMAPKPRPVEAVAEIGTDPHVVELALTIGKPPDVLGATLTVPRERGDARLPAVLMVAGSGPTDRDETVQSVKPFRDIARGLARDNIVTLRFDKRSFTYPRRVDGPEFTVDDEVINDAVVAMTMLRTRPEVDPSRLYVLGHSLGALVAPEIAARRGGIAGMILIAAPARTVPEMVVEQLREQGERPSELAPLENQVNTLPSMRPDQQVLGMRASYWQDLARRDEMGTARRLGIPILYLRGQLDRNVFAMDQAKWRRAFVGDVKYQSVTLPGLNHLLMPAGVDLSSDVRVSNDAIRKVTDFVLGSEPDGEAVR